MNGAWVDELADRAAAALGNEWLGVDTAVVLGSGLGEAAAGMRQLHSVAYDAVPGMAACAVPGHAGRLLLGELSGSRLLVFQGRRHYYEGLPMAEVAFPVRLARRLGCSRLALISAVGSTRTDVDIGSWVFVRDHINLMGENPLRGVATETGPAFVDMTRVYRADLLASLGRRLAGESAPIVRSGVLAAFSGPSYETPAEVGLARMLGADVVGMSIVPEAAWARFLGLEVVGLCRVANAGAGLAGGELDHAEVVAQSARGAGELRVLLEQLLDVWNEAAAAAPGAD